MFVDIIRQRKMVLRNSKFDLNKKPSDFCFNDELNKDDQFDDTALRLECVGHGTTSQHDAKSARDDGCRLILGLGRTPSVCYNERGLVLKLSVSDRSTAVKSDLNMVSDHQSSCVEVSNGFGEGSTSVKSSGGYMPSLLLAPRISVPLQKLKISESEPLVALDFLTETTLDQQTNSKKCEFLRCCHPTGCSEAARGKMGLCIKHGGGKRGVVEGCGRSGGGMLCCFNGCIQGAQGSTMFCKVHGGGTRCVFTGCTKGGKRPAVAGCTKSVCGRTNCYVKHEGKRYKFENHTTSAHGSTDVSKAHGSARRCISGGEVTYEKFARGKEGLFVAHKSRVQQTEENKNASLGIRPRLFHGLVSDPSPGSPDNHSSSCSSAVSNSTSLLGNPAKGRQLIPPQVLVPSSMKSSTFLQFTRQSRSVTNKTDGRKPLELVAPEGCVHGGSLLSFVSRNLPDAFIDEI